MSDAIIFYSLQDMFRLKKEGNKVSQAGLDAILAVIWLFCNNTFCSNYCISKHKIMLCFCLISFFIYRAWITVQCQANELLSWNTENSWILEI